MALTITELLLAGGAAYFAFSKPHFPGKPLLRTSVNAGWAGSSLLHRNHRAIDLVAPLGTPVFAMAPGVLVNVEPVSKTDCGRYVRIRHNLWGIGRIYSRYCHLDSIPPHLKVGDSVSMGETVGYAGSTGYSENPHLHLDVAVKDAEAMSNYIKHFGRAKNMDVSGAAAGRLALVPIEPLVKIDQYNRNVAAVSQAAGVHVA